MTGSASVRHLLSLDDLSAGEIETIFAISEDLKSKHQEGLRESLLPGRVMALLFEKPSLRTRVSFETAMINLGGGSLFLGQDAGWGKRESIADFGQVLSEYVDVIVVRAFRHEDVAALADHSTVPVINGLTDLEHPCQVLADLFTLRELVGNLDGQQITWVGDCNNVARSLAIACAKLGVRMHIACPDGYRFPDEFVQELSAILPGCQLRVSTDAKAAVKGASAVYTDVWASMGQENEGDKRKQDFASYQVNAALMRAAPDAYFLHCLPAKRGLEVTDEVIDGPQSVVIQQAGNRMHVQKGLLAWLLGSKGK